MSKKAVQSKEVIFGALVLLNTIFGAVGWPAFPTTPEFVAAVATVFIALRRWYTSSPISSWI